MKNLILSTLLLNVILCFSQQNQSEGTNNLRLQQIENINNANLWDMERVKNDITPINDKLPIRFGAFPVPEYKQLGAYKGGGLFTNTKARSIDEYKIMVENKEVVFDSFFIGDSPFYKDEHKNRSFFTILTVIDTVDTENFAIGATQFLSRNHPDYGGQGSIITKNNRVDYVAFTTPDKDGFAIVNMRLFHLEFGDIIVVVPQKDGSFRSLQIKGKKVSNDKLFDYIKNTVVKQKEVLDLINGDGVI